MITLRGTNTNGYRKDVTVTQVTKKAMSDEEETPTETPQDAETAREQPAKPEPTDSAVRERKDESGEFKRLVAALQNRLDGLEKRLDAHDKKFRRAGR